MGVVYQAKQLKLDRMAALKLMLGDDPMNKARFLAEGQVIAAVKHAHVVEVYDFGESVAGPYIAMEYLTGGTFGDRIKGGAMPPPDAAEQIAKIAGGVGAAHDLGVVHRDLKPGNVLLAADGTPKVTDFGLAKRSTSELTMTQDAAGTPAYMAPEQARAMKFVGPPADVWSLGVMLYEALTGKRPFVADTDVELLITIQESNPPTLRTVSKSIPRDLETICLKCLEKEPERRYANANELAADLMAWCEGKPIEARRATPVERAMLWVRRKPYIAAAWALSLLVIILVGFAATTTSLWQTAVAEKGIAEGEKFKADEARQRAEDAEQATMKAKGETDAANVLLAQQTKEAVEARRAEEKARKAAEQARDAETKAKKLVEESREKLARVEYARTLYSAHIDYQSNDLTRARLLLTSCRPDLRGWEWHYLHKLCHADQVTLSLRSDRENPRREEGRVPAPTKSGGAGSATFSPDGLRVVTVGLENTATAKVWDANTGALLLTLKGHTDVVRSVNFSADGSQLLTASFDGTAKVWDAKTGAEVRTLTGHGGRVAFASFSRNGKRIVTASHDKSSKVWDAETGVVLLTLSGHKDWVYSATFSPDDSTVVTASGDKSVKLWNAKTGEETATLDGHAQAVTAAQFSPDGARLVTASADGMAGVWDIKSGQGTALRGHVKGVRSAMFSPDGLRIVTASDDGSAKIWDVKTGQERLTLKGHTDTVWSATFNPDGSRIVTASTDTTAKIWDAKVPTESMHLAAPAGAPYLVSFNRDRSRFVTYGDDVAKVWEAKTGNVLHTLKGHAIKVVSAVFSADGSKIVTTGYDATARVWDAESGKLVHTFQHLFGEINFACFSPDGTLIAASFRNGQCRVLDATTGREHFVLNGHTDVVTRVCFSPDGTHLATSSYDKTAKVWDAKTGNEVYTLKGHTQLINSADFSPDSLRLVTSGGDVVKVWDVKSGAETLTLKAPWDLIPPAATFSSDGKQIVLAFKNNNQAVIYDASPVNVEARRNHAIVKPAR